MGKKHNKKIRKAFAGWDDISPEEQMRNADEFYNINKNNAEDILDLGISDKVLVDTETGLEKDIVDNIVDNFKSDDTPFEEDQGEDVVDNFFDSLEKEFEKEQEEEAKEEEATDNNDVTDDTTSETEEVTQVSEEVNEEATETIVEKEEEITKEDSEEETAEDDGVIEDIPVDDTPEKEEPEEDFSDVRKFGCVVRKDLGIVTFNDGLASFTINEHQAMVQNYADNVEESTITPEIIELFKTALICNRYPAAIYTKDEFVSMDVLGKGKFKQGDREQAVFVDVLNTYIAVYFVHHLAIERFSDTIREIIGDAGSDFADPYNNVWISLASILDSDHHSFDSDENYVEYFYNSKYNDKELVAKYLKAEYIEPSDDVCSVDIIGRDLVVSRFDYIMGEIFDDDLDEEYGDETPFDEIVDDKEVGTEEDLLKALDDNEASDKKEEKKDDSMVIPVFHKEGKK